MEFLVGAVESDDDQATVDAFYLVGTEGLVGDDGTGVDLGGIDRCLGLDGGGRHGGLGRDIGRAISIVDGVTYTQIILPRYTVDGHSDLDTFSFRVLHLGTKKQSLQTER